jgi:nitroreductase
VRQYRNTPVPQEILAKIMDAGLLAPTSMNRRPCRFFLVTDRQMLAKIAGVKKAGGQFVKDAAACAAVFGDEAAADTWMEDVSIALSFMMLEAQEQGIGSCWVQIAMRKGEDGSDAEDNLRALFGVPASYRAAGILALGYAENPLKARELTDEERSAVTRI